MSQVAGKLSQISEITVITTTAIKILDKKIKASEKIVRHFDSIFKFKKSELNFAYK